MKLVLVLAMGAALLMTSEAFCQGPKDPFFPRSRSVTGNARSPEVAFAGALRAIIREPKGSGSLPNTTGFVDLTIANLCGNGSLNEAAREFVNSAQDFWAAKQNKAVAFTIKITYADAAQPTVATIPLILLVPDGTKGADGKVIENTVNCNPIIVSGLPKEQPLLVRLDLKTTTNLEVTDNVAKALKAIGDILTNVKPLGPQTATAGATMAAFATALGPITNATNEFLKFFDSKETDIPTLFRWSEKAEALTFFDGKRPMFKLEKSFKTSNLHFTEGDARSLKQAFATKYGPEKSLSETYKGSAQEFGAFTADPTPARLSTFCSKLQSSVETAYGPDPQPVAMAVLYFLYDQQAQFAPKKYTCLSKPQVDTLTDLKFQAPYPGAFDPEGASKTGDQQAEVKGADREEYLKTETLLEGLARTLKNAPGRLPNQKAQVRADLSRLLESKIITTNWLAKGKSLLPDGQRGVPVGVLLDYFEKWGSISHFGCFSKPTATVDLAKGVTAETLIAFPDLKILALAQVTKTPQKQTLFAIELADATEDDVARLLGKDKDKCGRIGEEWDPRVELKAYANQTAQWRDNLRPGHTATAEVLRFSNASDF